MLELLCDNKMPKWLLEEALSSVNKERIVCNVRACLEGFSLYCAEVREQAHCLKTRSQNHAVCTHCFWSGTRFTRKI